MNNFGGMSNNNLLGAHGRGNGNQQNFTGFGNNNNNNSISWDQLVQIVMNDNQDLSRGINILKEHEGVIKNHAEALEKIINYLNKHSGNFNQGNMNSGQANNFSGNQPNQPTGDASADRRFGGAPVDIVQPHEIEREEPVQVIDERSYSMYVLDVKEHFRDVPNGTVNHALYDSQNYTFGFEKGLNYVKDYLEFSSEEFEKNELIKMLRKTVGFNVVTTNSNSLLKLEIAQEVFSLRGLELVNRIKELKKVSINGKPNQNSTIEYFNNMDLLLTTKLNDYIAINFADYRVPSYIDNCEQVIELLSDGEPEGKRASISSDVYRIINSAIADGWKIYEQNMEVEEAEAKPEDKRLYRDLFEYNTHVYTDFNSYHLGFDHSVLKFDSWMKLDLDHQNNKFFTDIIVLISAEVLANSFFITTKDGQGYKLMRSMQGDWFIRRNCRNQ